MRHFLERIRTFQKIDVDDTVDWTLSVDERSLLTQDIRRTDKSRKTLRKSCPNIGMSFERDVNMCLETLRNIDRQLANEVEMEEIDINTQMEIITVRSEIAKELDTMFDRLTYRVARTDGVFTSSYDDIVAQYVYKGKEFELQIWSLRNVPIRFQHMEYPLLMAELEGIDARVQMPLSVLMDNLTLRCVHTHFDVNTENAKSYECVITEEQDLNAGILDIEDCLVNEWLMQLEIQEDIIAKLLAKRALFEEIMVGINEKAAQAAKEAKGEGKVSKTNVPKTPKEPQGIPPGMVPDTYGLFLVREQKQYMEFLDDIFHPEKLALKHYEINLRKYIILGGNYSFFFVRRPGHTSFEKFNITLHEDGRILYTMSDIVANLGDGEDEESRLGPLLGDTVGGVPGTQRSRSRIETKSKSRLQLRPDAEPGTKIILNEDDLPFFHVTIKLPKHLCLWGLPVACQYMTEFEPLDVHRSEIQVAEIVPQKKKGGKKGAKKGADEKDAVSMTPALQKETDNDQRPLRFSQIQRPESRPSNIFRSTLLTMLRHSRLADRQISIVPLSDFNLEEQLGKTKIRNLERHCVPRIISSFKFPMEFREQLQMLDEELKSKTNRLLRRPVEEDVNLTADVRQYTFDYEEQQGPERMFPVFDYFEPILYPEEAVHANMEDEGTLYGLLTKLDNIKSQYVTNYKNVMNQPVFEPKRRAKKEKDVTMEEPQSTKTRSRSSTKGRDSTRSRSKHKMQEPSIHTLMYGSIMNLSTTNIGAIESVKSNILDPESVSMHSRLSVLSEYEMHDEPPKIEVTHWTTEHIFDTKFNTEEQTITIKTDRLGIFGFAYKRYDHFPFRDWSLQPSDENPDEIIFTLDTFHVRVILYVSGKGVRGYATDLSKEYVAKPVRYLDIEQPVSDFQELRMRFWNRNINIFAEHDACYYIDNGYFSIKHLATAEHTYDVMALHCKLIKFYRSSWNRLATRRDIIMCMKGAKDTSELSEVTIRVEPECTTFVEVHELCSDDLNVFKLKYSPTWRNIGTYSDAHQAIVSMFPQATDVRNKDALLIFQLKRLLSAVAPLCFS
ncbi:uncharacterized protein LOC115632132 isoform X2 [Scaptodrosophila lebanonensis]|nr:uncharacterized protein LOC115632132 isoform X2 [Scaptodrosophila lebanonensis]